MYLSTHWLRSALAAGSVVLLAATTLAQEEAGDPKDSKEPPIPPSTNPTGLVIFPGEDQTEEQQLTDQLECYRWATDRTDWDPFVAYDELVAAGHAAERSYEEAQGGAVRGAARGAAAGAIIGAIAGDAGKGAAIGATAGGLGGGMRSRRKRDAAQSEAEVAIEAFNGKLETWERNYAACMEGKDYTLK